MFLLLSPPFRYKKVVGCTQDELPRSGQSLTCIDSNERSQIDHPRTSPTFPDFPLKLCLGHPVDIRDLLQPTGYAGGPVHLCPGFCDERPEFHLDDQITNSNRAVFSPGHYRQTRQEPQKIGIAGLREEDARVPEKIEAVRTLLSNGTPVKDAAAAVGVSVPTLYRWLPGASR